MKLVVIGIGVVLALAGAVPLVAFGIVPLLVHSRLDEPPVAVANPIAAPRPVPSAPAVPAADPPAPPPTGLSGELRRVDAVHYGSGRVSISGPAGASVLRFDHVEVAAAPNLFVYLSDRIDGQPGHFTDLGPLKATSGSFNYPIPADLDLAGVQSVVLWCRAFRVTVTYADLN